MMPGGTHSRQIGMMKINEKCTAEKAGLDALAHNSIWRRAMALLLLGIFLPCLSASAQDAATVPDSLRIGITSSMFKDVDINDALVATKVWAEALLKKKGYKFAAQAIFLKDKVQVLEAVTNKSVDMVALQPSEYLELPAGLRIEPVFESAVRGRIGDNCLLLVHRQSGISTIEDLRGKTIFQSTSPYSSICGAWLEDLVVERGVATSEDYFKRVINAGKPSQTILPVFFHTADSCLVARGLFETMVELNPQLKADLTVMATSPPFVSSVIFMRTDYKPLLKKIVTESMLSLQTDPQGEQILNLYKIDKFVPFEESLLDNTRDELVKHERLKHTARTMAKEQPAR